MPFALRRRLITGALIFISPFAVAQITFGPAQERDGGQVEIRDLNWMNNNFLDQARQRAEYLLRQKYGAQFHQDRGDLSQLQRLIDSDALEDADKQTLQSLGAVLGDVFVSEHKDLNWKVYEDNQGASHAVCLDNTEHCIFPMTMLSRRLEAGLEPNVTSVFENALASIKPYFPKLPYTREGY